MENNTAPRTRRGCLVVGVLIGMILVIAVTAAVVVGVVYGLRKEDDEADQSSDIPVFLSVQSFGTLNKTTTFAVQYRARTDCKAERRLSQTGSSFMDREVLHAQIDEDGVSTVLIEGDISLGGYLDISVYCGHNHARIVLETTTLNVPGSQTFVNQTSEIPFDIVNAGLNTDTGEYNITLDIDKEKTIGYYFNGLNTSVSPAVSFEYFEHDVDNITGKYKTTAKVIGDIKRYNVIIAKDLVDAGGVFTIAGITDVLTKYVRDINVGMSMDITSPITGEIVPSGQYGLFPTFTGKSLDIYKDTYSLWCYVMGNPIPRVEIVVRNKENTDVKIESTELKFDEYSTVAVAVVTKRDFPDGGMFKCSTIPDGHVFEISFEFKEFEASSIDTNASGIIEQTPEKDVVRCTARGRPLPEVDIHLYDRYGPNLLDTGLFQASRSNTSDTVASVTLTVSPPNKDIHTVYCEGYQPGFPQINSPSLEIVLYQGREDNYTLADLMWTAIDENRND